MTKAFQLAVLIAVLLVAAAGCVTTNTADVSAFQHQVRAGMSESQVKAVLGEPIRVTIPWRHKLQGWMKVMEFNLTYGDEPGCPETEIGNALVSFATLGLSEMARQAKNRHRYRLYFHQGRYVAGCRVAKDHPAGRFCHELESDLLRLGYAGWPKTRYASRPRRRPAPVSTRQQRHRTGYRVPAGHTNRLQTGARPASYPGSIPVQGKSSPPDRQYGPPGPAIPPPPPGSIAPRW
jgi:hypothetical protein